MVVNPWTVNSRLGGKHNGKEKGKERREERKRKLNEYFEVKLEFYLLFFFIIKVKGEEKRGLLSKLRKKDDIFEEKGRDDGFAYSFLPKVWVRKEGDTS